MLVGHQALVERKNHVLPLWWLTLKKEKIRCYLKVHIVKGSIYNFICYSLKIRSMGSHDKNKITPSEFKNL